MIVALSAAILGATTLWILAPILGWTLEGEDEAGGFGSEHEELLETRRQTLASIKDLEMEFQVGKLTKEDYEETRERLAREAVAILKQIDSSSGSENPPTSSPRDGS
jgi:hypothetical protein